MIFRKITGNLIYQNAAIDIVHDACKLCYKGKAEHTLEGKLRYIEDKIKLGHESVIEHSNVIMLVTDKNKNYESYIEVLEAGKHINARSHLSNKRSYYLLGGSIRAFKEIFRNIKNTDNNIAKIILNTLYETPKEFYYDFIKHGIMSSNKFIDSDILYEENKRNFVNYDGYIIYNIDDINKIYRDIVDKIGLNKFDLDDLLDMCSVTIFFNNMSRIITQMVTRHEGGISQQSQRYVDESKAIVNNPLNYTNYLSKDTIFDIFGTEKLVTLDKFGEALIEIYNKLRNCGLKKEDARYYLPQGIQSSLYMTFTYRNLIHFLSLRTDKSAQNEIRIIADKILRDLKDQYGYYLGADLFKYLIPKYISQDINNDSSLYEEIIK